MIDVEKCELCMGEMPQLRPSFVVSRMRVEMCVEFANGPICGNCAAEMLTDAAKRCQSIQQRWQRSREGA